MYDPQRTGRGFRLISTIWNSPQPDGRRQTGFNAETTSQVGQVNASALLSLEQGRHTVAAVMACLDKLDPTTRFVALGLLAELHSPFHGDGSDPAHPLLETVRVSSEAVGRHSAISALFPGPQDDGHRFTPHIEPHIEELRVVGFDIVDFDDPDSQSSLPAPRPRHGDMLFDIVRVKEWGNPRDWSASSLSWLVRAGQWAYWNMNEISRVLLCRTAAASISHRDPATASLTLKLGRQLGFASLLGSDGHYVDMTVEDTLAGVGELPKESHRDGAWMGDMYSRFNTALFSLCNHGALNDVTWPTNYRFNGLNGNGPTPSDWMTARIQLKAPAVAMRHPGKPAYSALHHLKV